MCDCVRVCVQVADAPRQVELSESWTCVWLLLLSTLDDASCYLTYVFLLLALFGRPTGFDHFSLVRTNEHLFRSCPHLERERERERETMPRRVTFLSLSGISTTRISCCETQHLFHNTAGDVFVWSKCSLFLPNFLLLFNKYNLSFFLSFSFSLSPSSRSTTHYTSTWTPHSLFFLTFSSNKKQQTSLEL